jgi:hypothetical protein
MLLPRFVPQALISQAKRTPRAPSRAFRPAASEQQLGALLLSKGDISQHLFVLRLVVDRTHVRAALQRMPDLDLAYPIQNFAKYGVVNVFM